MFLAGKLTSRGDGHAKYRHFLRQMEGPSKLRWLIMQHAREEYRCPQGIAAGGSPTSFLVPGMGWQHSLNCLKWPH
jgi:hypothetical protein